MGDGGRHELDCLQLDLLLHNRIRILHRPRQLDLSPGRLNHLLGHPAEGLHQLFHIGQVRLDDRLNVIYSFVPPLG